MTHFDSQQVVAARSPVARSPVAWSPVARSLVVLSIVASAVLAGCESGDQEAERPPTATSDTTSASVVADGPGRPVRLEEAWRWPARPPASVGMPVADAGGVAATYGRLGIVLLDLDGSVIWKVEHARLRDVRPTFTHSLVVAATESGVVALDRATGAVEWETRVDERANSPVVVGNRVVVSTWEGSLIAFDLVGGAAVWQAPLPGPAIAPAASDGATVVSTWESMRGDSAGVVAVAASDGREVWSVPLEPGGVGGPAVAQLEGGAGAVVVVVAGDIAAHGLDLTDGTELWRSDTAGRGSPEVPPLPLEGDRVLVPDRLAGLAIHGLSSGERGWGGEAAGAAVRGGPVAAGPEGPFALPLDHGPVLVVGPGWGHVLLEWPGRVSGVAAVKGPGGLLFVATRESRQNHLIALAGL